LGLWGLSLGVMTEASYLAIIEDAENRGKNTKV